MQARFHFFKGLLGLAVCPPLNVNVFELLQCACCAFVFRELDVKVGQLLIFVLLRGQRLFEHLRLHLLIHKAFDNFRVCLLVKVDNRCCRLFRRCSNCWLFDRLSMAERTFVPFFTVTCWEVYTSLWYSLWLYCYCSVNMQKLAWIIGALTALKEFADLRVFNLLGRHND